MLGTFYRASHPQPLKSFVKLRNNLLFAINMGIFFRGTGTKTRIFLVHEKIKLITEGIVALKCRKGIHLHYHKQVVCQLQETLQKVQGILKTRFQQNYAGKKDGTNPAYENSIPD